MKRYISKPTIIIIAVFIIFISTLVFTGYSSGISGKTQKDSHEGCDCHGGINSSVNVEIVGPEEVFTGSSNTYTIKISGGPLVKAGVNIATNVGVLVNNNTDLIKIGNELTHSTPKSPNQGIVSFEMSYLAPEQIGEAKIYATGNSVNGNGTSSGDRWNFAPNKVIQITKPTDIKETNIVSNFKLFQNYPNPFNPSTTINFNLNKSGFVKITIYNHLGQEVETILNNFKNAGQHSVLFSPHNLTSGLYYYTLSTSGFSETRKMIYTK